LPEISDFSAGWGDMVSFGITNLYREWRGTNRVVNKSSWAYWTGEAFGFANLAAEGWVAGARSAVKGWAHFSHSLFPKRYLKKCDLPIARWMNKRGNRLNGDFITRELHNLIDPVQNKIGKSLAERLANPPYPVWRQMINRIPYFPASILYGLGSLGMNQASQ
jgi:hypothetical protein